MNYKLAYALGFHPWEDAEKQRSFNERFTELLEREESGRQPPYGRALDIGTGSGIWGIKLAERGWQVVGIDIVEKASSAHTSGFRILGSRSVWCKET